MVGMRRGSDGVDIGELQRYVTDRENSREGCPMMLCVCCIHAISEWSNAPKRHSWLEQTTFKNTNHD